MRYIFYLIVLTILIGLQVWNKTFPDQKPAITLLYFLLLAIFPRILEWLWKKIVFNYQFGKTKNRLDGQSLQLYANEFRGLPFVIPRHLSSESVRYLINLQLLQTEIFPGTLHYTYRLTDLGRKLLEKELRFPLYPKSFCDMRLLVFWRGYNKPPFKDFDKKKAKFQKEFLVSWDECVIILRCFLTKKNFKIDESDDDAVRMFDNYFNTVAVEDSNECFAFFMDDLVNPWLVEVRKRQKRKWLIRKPRL